MLALQTTKETPAQWHPRVGPSTVLGGGAEEELVHRYFARKRKEKEQQKPELATDTVTQWACEGGAANRQRRTTQDPKPWPP